MNYRKKLGEDLDLNPSSSITGTALMCCSGFCDEVNVLSLSLFF